MEKIFDEFWDLLLRANYANNSFIKNYFLLRFLNLIKCVTINRINCIMAMENLVIYKIKEESQMSWKFKIKKITPLTVKEHYFKFS